MLESIHPSERSLHATTRVILNICGRPMIRQIGIFRKLLVTIVPPLVGVILLCFSPALLCSCGPLPKTSTERLISGKEFFKAGDYKHAQEEFKGALQQAPNDITVKATASNNLGVIYNEEGRYDEAVTMLKDAIAVDPKNAIAHYVLANALTKKGKFDEALAEAQTATELDKTEPAAFRAVGEAALGKGDAALAIAAYRSAIELDSNDEQEHHRLAQALGEVQDWEGAIEEERKALELNPDNVDARINLAVALHKRGDGDESIDELKTVLKKDSQNADAKRYLEAFAHDPKG